MVLSSRSANHHANREEGPMAALWWNSHERNSIDLAASGILLSVGWRDGAPIIPALQTLIAQNMTGHLGFSDVHTNASEVAGGKLDVWASIAYFECPLATTDQLEVVMTAGDAGEDAKNVNDELVFMLSSIFSD
jgi:hypothetical protein